MDASSRLSALSLRASLRLLLVLGSLCLLSACGSEAGSGGGAGGGGAGEPEAEALARRGRQVYETNCLACHSPDPAKDGAVGPAIAGSSLELLRAKVLHNEYPPGYTPKRATGNMVALPHLEKDLPALAAYLAQ